MPPGCAPTTSAAGRARRGRRSSSHCTTWHERHGLTVGVDQQSPSREGDPLGGARQYADYPRTHRWFSAPGSDHHGDAKIHSSLAHHYGRPRTWIEAFHSTGWGGTLEETFDWLAAVAASPAPPSTTRTRCTTPRAAAGGSGRRRAPAGASRTGAHYQQFADTVSRLCWLLTRGEHVCDVGVLFPSATVQAGTLLERRPAGTPSGRTARTSTSWAGWCGSTPEPGVLDRAHRDFDVLDDDTVARRTGRDGALHTARRVLPRGRLPSCTVLEAATARRLVEFCRGRRAGRCALASSCVG